MKQCSECDAMNCESIKSNLGRIVMFYEADYESCVSVNAILFFHLFVLFFFLFLPFSLVHTKNMDCCWCCLKCYGCCRIAMSIPFRFSHCRNIHKIYTFYRNEFVPTIQLKNQFQSVAPSKRLCDFHSHTKLLKKNIQNENLFSYFLSTE